eukprot:m.164133 g.164133  ORF g.164133 m.164133 type:complete len:64 (+) comp38868_c0_seq8:994-1185(+)
MNRDVENCYYQGKIRNQPGSFAAVSTCNGALRGFFSTGGNSTLESQYLIEPIDDKESKYTLFI